MKAVFFLMPFFLVSCASTSSVVLNSQTNNSTLAVLPLDGAMGNQASDLIAQELAVNDIETMAQSKIVPLVAVDTDLSASSPDAIKKYADLGERLGVKYVLTGTVSAEGGPLYSFKHVNMTLNLIDVRTGETRWIGRYGNSLWTSAISQQGDLQRGSKAIVREFVASGGKKLISQ